ncbi:hypothetical protein IC235_19385 [Hymenobacter sp. BT664]|uniref:Lipoprotein n=1 Tax=Hymenobacter montanus TaxID=2771359 RepID=A0A927BHE9_9BACT|nr:hypothetical protein [Hymenobacter montanus]MBD2770057.1 hypothetical protein [Hymenobacter montanus]
MKHFHAALLLALGSALGACNNGPSTNDQPITGDHPVRADTTAVADTIGQAPGSPAPFVNPTKVGQALGEQSPSPPASRTH